MADCRNQHSPAFLHLNSNMFKYFLLDEYLCPVLVILNTNTIIQLSLINMALLYSLNDSFLLIFGCINFFWFCFYINMSIVSIMYIQHLSSKKEHIIYIQFYVCWFNKCWVPVMNLEATVMNYMDKTPAPCRDILDIYFRL